MVNITGRWRLDYFFLNLHKVIRSQDQTTRAFLVKKPILPPPHEPSRSDTPPNLVASFQTFTCETHRNLKYSWFFFRGKWELNTLLSQRNTVINNMRRAGKGQRQSLSKAMLRGSAYCHENRQGGSVEWNHSELRMRAGNTEEVLVQREPVKIRFRANIWSSHRHLNSEIDTFKTMKVAGITGWTCSVATNKPFLCKNGSG